MTRNELLELHRALCDEARDLQGAKNADYSGGSDDILANFRHYGMGGVSLQQGIFTRMVDKMSRLGGMVNGHEAQVKDEAMRDTIRDLMNYAVLLQAASVDAEFQQ